MKAAHFPSQPYGLPESMSFGGVRDSDLSTAEATFDLVFSSRVNKRYTKYQLGILCLILVPPTPPFLWDAEPLANIPLQNLMFILLPSKYNDYLQFIVLNFAPIVASMSARCWTWWPLAFSLDELSEFSGIIYGALWLFYCRAYFTEESN